MENFELLKVLGTGGECGSAGCSDESAEAPEGPSLQDASHSLHLWLLEHKRTPPLSPSVRESVPGQEGERPRRREAVRHEGAEEGHHRAEGQDGRTHAHGAPSAGAHSPVPLPRDPPLRLPDRHQAAPHPGSEAST